MYNIPNLLSMYRIVCIPFIASLFFFDNAFATWLNVIIFALACISDLADGIIARRTGQTTILGKFLDSSSDKILVGGVLMLLVAFDRLTGIWVIAALIIFVREILVAGLREFMTQYGVSVPISALGKWKATIQMVASGFLIAGEYGRALIPYAPEIGLFIFFIATVMTVISGWDYIKAGYKTMLTLDEEKKV
jgi:cardiolipin synthase